MRPPMTTNESESSSKYNVEDVPKDKEGSAETIKMDYKARILEDMGLEIDDATELMDESLLIEYISFKKEQEKRETEHLKQLNLLKVNEILSKLVQTNFPLDIFDKMLDTAGSTHAQAQQNHASKPRKLKRRRQDSPIQEQPTPPQTRGQHRRYRSEVQLPSHKELGIQISPLTRQWFAQPNPPNYGPQAAYAFPPLPPGAQLGPPPQIVQPSLPPLPNFNPPTHVIQQQDIGNSSPEKLRPQQLHLPHQQPGEFTHQAQHLPPYTTNKMVHRRSQSTTVIPPTMSTFTVTKSPISNNTRGTTHQQNTPSRRDSQTLKSVNFLIHTPKHPPPK